MTKIVDFQHLCWEIALKILQITKKIIIYYTNINICYFFLFLQQVVELNGYVIILVETREGKIKLYGSPADKENLEVGDEILDINEKKLDDLSRADVIRHIHEVS